MDKFGLFEETIEKLVAKSKISEKLDSLEILTYVSELTDIFYVSPDSDCSFGHLLDLTVSIQHMEKSINSVAILIAEVRKRGILSLGNTHIENTTRRIVTLERISNGMLNMVDDVFKRSSRGNHLTERGLLSYLSDANKCIKDDISGMLVQLWDRFPKTLLYMEAGNYPEKNLLICSQNKYRGPPIEVRSDNFKTVPINKKMQLKLDTRSEFICAAAPHNICKICNDVVFTSLTDFIILDSCFHLFCDPCIRSKMNPSEA